MVDVEEGSPAEQIGLHAGELDSVVIQGSPGCWAGDIISVDGQDVKTSEQWAPRCFNN